MRLKCKVKERVRHIVWLLLEEASQVVWYGLLSLEHIYVSLSIFVSDLSKRETKPGAFTDASIVYIYLVLFL